MKSAIGASDANRAGLERIEMIDAIRALALFGVIIMNIGGMVMRFVGNDVMADPSGLDISLVVADSVFIAGKARAAFAFLFGLGFGILLFRTEAKGADFRRYFTRRMLALLAFGAINQVFLFWGDILMLYALLGLVLMAMRGLSATFFLKIGLALILVPPIAFAIAEWYRGGALQGLIALNPDAETARAITALMGGSYPDAIAYNATQGLLRRASDTTHMIAYDLGVLGLFMVGAWSVRSGLLHQLAERRGQLKRIMAAGFLIGLPLSVFNALPLIGIKAEGLLGPVITASYAGSSFLAFGYLAALALAFDRNRGWAVRILAPAGRMALTNYLASGAIGSLIFYGYGLGLLRTVGFVEVNVIALAIFAALAVFSHLWLAVFRYGPVEWLWRSLSYGRVQPMLREPRVPVTA